MTCVRGIPSKSAIDRYYSGLDSLNIADADRAIGVLAQFDVVLLLEHKAQSPNILEQALGWWAASDLDRKHGRRRHGATSPNAKDMQRIANANTLDLKVYNAAETLFKLDVVAFSPPHPAVSGNSASNPLTCANQKRKVPSK